MISNVLKNSYRSSSVIPTNIINLAHKTCWANCAKRSLRFPSFKVFQFSTNTRTAVKDSHDTTHTTHGHHHEKDAHLAHQTSHDHIKDKQDSHGHSPNAHGTTHTKDHGHGHGDGHGHGHGHGHGDYPTGHGDGPDGILWGHPENNKGFLSESWEVMYYCGFVLPTFLMFIWYWTTQEHIETKLQKKVGAEEIKDDEHFKQNKILVD